MNWIDIIVILVGLVCAWAGWRHGIIGTDFWFAGLVGSGIMSVYYYRPVADSISPEGAAWSPATGFCMIAAGIIILAAIANRLVLRLADFPSMERVNKPLGSVVWAVFGGLFSFVLLGLASICFTGIGEQVIEQSGFGRFLT